MISSESNKPGKIRARAPFVPSKNCFQWSRREFSVKVRALFPYRPSIPGFKIQTLVSLAISWRQEGRRGVARKGAGQGVSGCSPEHHFAPGLMSGQPSGSHMPLKKSQSINLNPEFLNFKNQYKAYV